MKLVHFVQQELLCSKKEMQGAHVLDTLWNDLFFFKLMNQWMNENEMQICHSRVYLEHPPLKCERIPSN